MSLSQQIEDNSWDLFFIECSFCGNRPDNAGELVIGPRLSICKDCVKIAAEHLGLIHE